MRLDLAVTVNIRTVVDVLRGNGKGAFSAFAGSPFTVSSAIDASTTAPSPDRPHEDGASTSSRQTAGA